MTDLERIHKELTEIKSLLQNLPEIQAAVYLQMLEEYNAARLQGKTTADLWTIAPPNSR